MSKGLKITLIIVSVIGVAVLIYFIVKATKKPTMEQFSQIKAESDKQGYDIFEFPPEKISEVFQFFQKNLSFDEADEMLVAVKQSKENKSEETKMLMLFNKMLQGYKK